MDRVKTGIEGLDFMIKGGVPNGNLVLVSGGAGTGKSTLCTQFLIHGATNGEKCLYISTEQNQEQLHKAGTNYGWNLNELVEAGNLKIEYIDVVAESNFFDRIRKSIKEFQPTRVVIDSLNTFSDYVSVNEYAKLILLAKGGASTKTAETIVPGRISEKTFTRRMLLTLINGLRNTRATIFLTTELPERGGHLSADGVSEFLCDGVILLHYTGIAGEDSSYLEVKKLRYSGHERGFFPFDIQDGKGIVVQATDSRSILMK